MIASLVNPREKIWGQLIALRPEGITLRGITLESFDDFLHQVTDRLDVPVSLTTAFYPMHRVERITCDETSAGIPSLSDRFREKAGLTVQEYFSSKERRT